MATRKQFPRGIRDEIPSGYILGRTDQGKGRVHLIRLNTLVSEKGLAPANHGFGFFDGGRYANNELLGSAVYGNNILFPASHPAPSVTSLIAAAATAVFRLITTISGTDTQVGTITFNAGSMIGVVAWSGGHYLLPAGQALRLYSPLVADTTLAFVTGTVYGTLS